MTPAITDWFIQRNATVASGDVAEGCAERTSGVDLLRFGVRANNVGNADLTLGDPQCPDCASNPLAACGNANFMCSPSSGHNHPHYGNYARYELLDANGQSVIVGHKQGFCLLDSSCAQPQYTCSFQGISAGCSDVYGSNLGCQYLDITGVAPAQYQLRVTLDPFGRIAELSDSNNVVSVPVAIPGDSTPPPANACDSPTVVPPAGGIFTGTTIGASTQSGSCGRTGSSPEKVFQWTPARSGRATIQTCGSSTTYDSVLYLRSGTCTGSQLACNDDTSGCPTSGSSNRGSRLRPTVTAGQTYFIFVDGYDGASGNFRLSVAPPP